MLRMNALLVRERTLETGKNIKVSLMDKQIRVLIVDDHSGVRAGLKKLLLAAKDIEVVGEGGSGTEAIELVALKIQMCCCLISNCLISGVILSCVTSTICNPT
jgi:hypothetical protein